MSRLIRTGHYSVLKPKACNSNHAITRYISDLVIFHIGLLELKIWNWVQSANYVCIVNLRNQLIVKVWLLANCERLIQPAQSLDNRYAPALRGSRSRFTVFFFKSRSHSAPVHEIFVPAPLKCFEACSAVFVLVVSVIFSAGCVLD